MVPRVPERPRFRGAIRSETIRTAADSKPPRTVLPPRDSTADLKLPVPGRGFVRFDPDGLHTPRLDATQDAWCPSTDSRCCRMPARVRKREQHSLVDGIQTSVRPVRVRVRVRAGRVVRRPSSVVRRPSSSSRRTTTYHDHEFDHLVLHPPGTPGALPPGEQRERRVGFVRKPESEYDFLLNAATGHDASMAQGQG